MNLFFQGDLQGDDLAVGVVQVLDMLSPIN